MVNDVVVLGKYYKISILRLNFKETELYYYLHSIPRYEYANILGAN